VLRLEMLPVAHGDALLVEYGGRPGGEPGGRPGSRPGSDSGGRRGGRPGGDSGGGAGEPVRRILVDAGPAHTYPVVRERLAALAPDEHGERRIELLIVTHVDGDHIEGVVRLLQDRALRLRFGDIWFNGWAQLARHGDGAAGDTLGPTQGEFLDALIDAEGLPANEAFGGEPVVVPAAGPLPTVTLAGGLRLTVVSPGPPELDALRRQWDKVVRDAGFEPGDHDEALERLRRRAALRVPDEPPDRLGPGDATADNSVANGSSIAVVLEHEDGRLLLAGDAHAPVLERGLARWEGAGAGGRLPLDALKLAHHGSRANLTVDLLDRLDCRRFLVSTNGAKFGHPDRAAVELLLAEAAGEPEVWFNHRCATTERWDDPARQAAERWRAVYPPASLGLDL
jgi:hypothetical protein